MKSSAKPTRPALYQPETAKVLRERVRTPSGRKDGTDLTQGKIRPVIVQAFKDLKNGLVDTDMRATPGLDAQKRAKDVTGPGGRPPPKGALGDRRK